MSNKISREKYAMMYGPTVGDKFVWQIPVW